MEAAVSVLSYQITIIMLGDGIFFPDDREEEVSLGNALPPLPTFSGAGRGISVNRFLEKMEARMSLCKWDTGQVRCVLLELLQGPALQAYREMTAKECEDPKLVFAKLRELFGNATHQRQLARSTFQSAVQRESETVVQFFWRMKGLLQSGYTELSKNDIETRMHEKLLSSLFSSYYFKYYREKSAVCQERYCDKTGCTRLEKYNQFKRRGRRDKYS